jgi:hypothetical protein
MRRAVGRALAVVALSLWLSACSHLHWPWQHRPPPGPPLVHELVVSVPDGATAPTVPQYWKRNTLVLDLTAASGTGTLSLKPAPGHTWPVRLALRARPGSIGELDVRADQRVVLPVTATGHDPIDLELSPGVYGPTTQQLSVSWGPADQPGS